MTKNPYKSQPEKAFWASAVAGNHPMDIHDLWVPKFEITKKDRIVTFGSCFAQHFGKALAARGYDWKNYEFGMLPHLPIIEADFNYGVFSARTGNIYTTSLLRQWLTWTKTGGPDEMWQEGDRWFDPFRPIVEPNGFSSPEELSVSRECTIEAFGTAVAEADVFVFTLGLTESWWNATSGLEYPMCPGTARGVFDPDEHRFLNQSFKFILDNLTETIAAMRDINPGLRILLTVSPVPLTATATNDHVLVATMKSKSVLRAVADEVAGTVDGVDYFPSFEIINSPAMQGFFFEPNKRNVSPHGVAHVMNTFFDAQNSGGSPQGHPVQSAADVQCEEALLEAFGKKTT